jgi:hypothetical protein
MNGHDRCSTPRHPSGWLPPRGPRQYPNPPAAVFDASARHPGQPPPAVSARLLPRTLTTYLGNPWVTATGGATARPSSLRSKHGAAGIDQDSKPQLSWLQFRRR